MIVSEMIEFLMTMPQDALLLRNDREDIYMDVDPPVYTDTSLGIGPKFECVVI